MSNLSKGIIITGPTAVGKTALAVKLAGRFGGEIISIDSRQVFRGMDLGTGKDLEEYGDVSYHLIDVADPAEIYHLKRFLDESAGAFRQILERGRLPFFCGGTALYLNAILRRYELNGGEPDFAGRDELRELSAEELVRRLPPEIADSLADCERSNRERLLRRLEKSAPGGEPGGEPFPQFDKLVLGVYYPRAEIHHRIEQRLDRRLDEGMIEEVHRLHEQGVSWEKLEFFGLEYRMVAQYLQGKIDRRTMRDSLLAKIRQFAKRQDIWFRKMEREGVRIHWVERGNEQDAARLVEDFMAGRELPEPYIRLNDIHYGPKSG